MRRGLAKPRRKKQLAPTCCICIGKQTAAGSLWLARKMNKIMKKKGKFRVEMQKSNGGAGRGERGGGAAERPHCQLSDSRGMKRGGRTSIREGLCCAIFARRVQIVGEKIPRLLFLRRSSPLAANGSFSSTYVCALLLSRENLIARENYNDRTQ